MSLPPKTDPSWKAIVTGTADRDVKSLASKLLLQRLRRTVASDSASTQAAIDELYTFVSEHAFAQAEFSS